MEISKDELKKLYETKPNREICELLQVSNSTLVATLKRVGIKMKKRGNPQGGKQKITIIE